VAALPWNSRPGSRGTGGHIAWNAQYQHGKGVMQDYSEAIKFYRAAAEHDFAIAQFNLGFMYHKGYGVAHDVQEAKKWYQKAANNGIKEAARILPSLESN
jgi:hypothetical protein